MVDEEEMTAYYEITLGGWAVIMTCMAEDKGIECAAIACHCISTIQICIFINQKCI